MVPFHPVTFTRHDEEFTERLRVEKGVPLDDEGLSLMFTEPPAPVQSSIPRLYLAFNSISMLRWAELEHEE